VSTFLPFQTGPSVLFCGDIAWQYSTWSNLPENHHPLYFCNPAFVCRTSYPSTIDQSDYSDDETAFVGLVPGTDSLFALSPDHFPLVAFSESAPTQRIEGSEGVVVSGEHGTLQCFEGTTDRQCLTGLRALRADSRSRLARLLDGVPGPATSSLPSTTSDPARSENTNSQAYAESEPLIVPGEAKPLGRTVGVGNSVPESLSQGRKPWAHSSSALLLALVSVIASLLWFNRKVPSDGHNYTVHMNTGPVPGQLVREMPADGNAVSISPWSLPTVRRIQPPQSRRLSKVCRSVKPTPPRSPFSLTEFATMTYELPTTAPTTAPNAPMPLPRQMAISRFLLLN
jgi:hypothetical protein